MKERIDWLDECKGMAIILVVLGHVISGYMNSGLFIDEKWILTILFNIIYSFHMALFFVLSGYVFQVSYNKRLPNAKIQLINLTLIYLAFSILFGITKLYASNITITGIGIKDILMIPIQPIGEFWYLYTLIVFYLVMILLSRIKTDINVILLLSCFGSLLLSAIFTDIRLHNLLYYFMFFHFGYWTAYNKNGINKIFIIMSMTVMVISLLVTFRWKMEIRSIPVINSIVGLAYCISIIELFQKKIHLRFLRYLGKKSLDIYIWHTFFTAVIRSVLIGLNINLWMSIFLDFIMSLMIPLYIVGVLNRIGCYDVIMRPYKFMRLKHQKQLSRIR